ncbi:hypothetical protein C8Q77DRAFT_393144 [Trametes polyzona]|nr:hypothetical protein C8Q77DRAFT_393144 [Trametes polyzona]
MPAVCLSTLRAGNLLRLPATRPSPLVSRGLSSTRRPRQRKAMASQTPIRDFFDSYPEFDYDHTAPFHGEYLRMGKELHWNREEREAARDALRHAMVQQFNNVYGTNAEDLESWQLLCNALGMDPVPDKLKACRRKVRATHVNLVDFIEAPLAGKPVTTFKTEVELSEYTRENGKFFPRDDVYAGSLLQYLLRQILNPPARRTGDANTSRRAVTRARSRR